MFAYIGIPVLFAPFYVGSWWLIWHYRGKFILTEDGILLEQWRKQTFLRYQEIHTIAERGSQLIPYLFLSTNDLSLSIPFQVENFSELYANLKQRVSALRSAALEKLPITLRHEPGYARQVALAIFANLVFTGILSMGLAYETRSFEKGIVLWGVFIILIAFVLWWNERQSPYQVQIDKSQIEARYLFRKTRLFAASDIKRIERERQVRRIRYGAKIYVYPLVITFDNGERFQLEEGRIWAFGYSPERLHAILTHQFTNQHRRSL